MSPKAIFLSYAGGMPQGKFESTTSVQIEI